MFSGIIETVGKICYLADQGEGRLLTLESSLPTEEITLGDSIAVDGCCLTVSQIQGENLQFFVSHETLNCTTAGGLKEGDGVNLERSVKASQRLDGHIVQGHVEAVGELIQVDRKGDSVEIEIRAPGAFKPLLIPKGSIAVDGISLTINRIHDEKDGVRVMINLIPVTLEKTTLGQKGPGAAVNLETDLLGRYVKRQLDLRSA